LTRPAWTEIAAFTLVLVASQAAGSWWLRTREGEPSPAGGPPGGGGPPRAAPMGPGGVEGAPPGEPPPQGPGGPGMADPKTALPTPKDGTGADFVARLDTKLARQVIAEAERQGLERRDLLPPDDLRRAAILSDSLDSGETRALLDAYSAALQRLKVEE
jgi:hypothetical protein